ncbi:MAG TPA: ATP-binding protein [Dyella sp.]|nr:ATP-binding protein [Dyella sp.]
MSWLRSRLLGSIRARLLLLLLGGLGTLMFALFLLLDYSIDRQIFGRLDATLLGRARGVVVLLESHPRDAAWQELHELSPEYATGGHTDFLQIWDAGGGTLLSSASNAASNLQRPPAPVPANAPLFYDLRLPDGHRGRAVGLRFTLPGRAGDAVLVVAEEREQVDQLERRVHLALVIGVLGMGLLAALLSVLAVRGGLRPLLAFAADTGPDGAPRIEPLPVARMPAELQPFADTLNAAFARLQAALGRERRFARDVAHELRTPLAETRMAVELAGRAPPSPEVLAGALASIDRMQRCIDGLLALSRYEAGIDRAQVEPLELVDLLRRSLAMAAAPAAQRTVSIDTRLPGECWVLSDPALLERIVDNLLLNAVEYAPGGSRVQVALADATAGWTLRIGNEAPELSPEDLARLGERFWRKSAARESSHHGGLGLALAGTLAGVLDLQLGFALERGVLWASLGPLRPIALPEGPGS